MENMHEVIRGQETAVSRKGETVRIFLEMYYRRLFRDIEQAMEGEFPDDFPLEFYSDLENRILPNMKTYGWVILRIAEYEESNLQIKMREEFRYLMRKMADDGAFRILSLEEGRMIRIRPGIGPYERKDLFHIPFSERRMASPQRFSMPGVPCLYLSAFPGLHIGANEMAELAWRECGMPKRFSACIFMQMEKQYFLHFAKSGSEYLRQYDHAQDGSEKKDREEAIKEYLLSLPLRIACSIRNESRTNGKDASFVEEYVFPQLLMEWLQRQKKFSGIAYRSAAGIPDAGQYWSYNLAMPVREIDGDGFDKHLKKAFKLTEPIVYDAYEVLEKSGKEINDVRGYVLRTGRLLDQTNAAAGHPYYKLKDNGEAFLQLCDGLNKGIDRRQGSKDRMIEKQIDELRRLWDDAEAIGNGIRETKTADEWIMKQDSGAGYGMISQNDYEEVLNAFAEKTHIYLKLLSGLKPNIVTLNSLDSEFDYI